jgi:hypothetical protein
MNRVQAVVVFAHECIIDLSNIHILGRRLSPNGGLVYEGRLDSVRVSLSGVIIRGSVIVVDSRTVWAAVFLEGGAREEDSNISCDQLCLCNGGPRRRTFGPRR